MLPWVDTGVTNMFLRQVCRDLLLALRDFSDADQEINLFGKFVGGVYDSDDLSFFVHGWSRVLPLFHELSQARAATVSRSRTGSADPSPASDADETGFLRRLYLYDDQCKLLMNELFEPGERAAIRPNFWRHDRSSGYVAVGVSSLDSFFFFL